MEEFMAGSPKISLAVPRKATRNLRIVSLLAGLHATWRSSLTIISY
jgi:hypothetical protein